jgi:glycosyltransferase involved in cell wall biosynthesis
LSVELNVNPARVKTVAAYTFAPWEHALAMLRIVSPLKHAGLELLRGVEAGRVDTAKAAEADLILLQRDFPHSRAAFEEILSIAQEKKVPLVLDLDDLLLELPPDHPDKAAHQDSGVLLPILGGILQVDAVTVSSVPLRDYLLRFNPNVFLLPNYLDEDIWSLQAPPGPQHALVIGYMGGNSHRPDLDFVLPALQAVLEEHERLKLHFYGLQPPQALRDDSRVIWTPVESSSYAEFAAHFSNQHWDILIAPLKDNLFNRSKSAVKFLEYSALGVPGVYSRILPYERLVQDGVNGLLAARMQDWQEGLNRLIESSTLRRRIGSRAQETLRRNWLISQHAGAWAETYQRLSVDLETIRSRQAGRRNTLQALKQTERWYQELLERLSEQQERLQAVQHALHQKELELQNLQTGTHQENKRPNQRLLDRLHALRLKLAPPGSAAERLWQSAKKRLGAD